MLPYRLHKLGENHVTFRFYTFFSALLLSLSIWPLCANAETKAKNNFTPSEQTEIQTIVHDYLLDHPEILIQVAQKLQQQQSSQMQKQAVTAVAANTQKLFFSSTSPMAGNAKGDITLIEFFDYQCPHCKEMEPVISQLLKSDPNLRFVFKEFPIFGDISQLASRAALAARQQDKYQAMHAALMKAKPPFTEKQILDLAKSAGLNIAQLKADMNSPTVQQEIKNNLKLANALGLPGTPGFVIAPTPQDDFPPNVNKIFVLPGGTELSTFQNMINEARKN